MENYYQRADVREAILDFARASNGNPVRECAFYNPRVRGVQRYLTRADAEREHPIVFDSHEALELALRANATAFYGSYWRYAYPHELRYPIGHDLVWTIRARHGGLRFARYVTTLVIEALAEGGLQEPWVKYSGQLGFDLVIPLEAIPADAWKGDPELLASLQRELTRYMVGHLLERRSDFCIDVSKSRATIKLGRDTCLLSELRSRRGLLLAPMSLHPESGLASIPLSPDAVADFSVLDASPACRIKWGWIPVRNAAGKLLAHICKSYALAQATEVDA